MVTEFRVSIFQQFLPPEGSLSTSDRLAETFVSSGLELKAFALFSLLFGVGLAIQFDRLSNRGRALYWLARRLAVLLLLGLIHLLLIWNGDILTEYALAGFLVLPFLCAPTWVLAVGFASLLAFYVAMPLLHLPIPWLDMATLPQHVAEANRVYATGGVDEIRRFSFSELPLWAPLHITFSKDGRALFPRRIRVANRTAAAPWPIQARTCGRSLDRHRCRGCIDPGRRRRMASWDCCSCPGLRGCRDGACPTPRTGRALSVFAPLGRMAFTNYVMQSVIFGFIFFGYGLGQFSQLGAANALALGVAVYVAQMVFGAWWLDRFRFGPLEWLWRTLMYGEVQSMVAAPHEAGDKAKTFR